MIWWQSCDPSPSDSRATSFPRAGRTFALPSSHLADRDAVILIELSRPARPRMLPGNDKISGHRVERGQPALESDRRAHFMASLLPGAGR